MGNKKELNFLPINKIQNIILMKIILEYSAKKIKANPLLLYSTLNPETNSDSPSEKSKGERLVSAIEDDNQQIDKGNIKNINHILC